MSLESKIAELNNVIAEAVFRLRLKFVSGPDNTSVSPGTPDIEAVNGANRATLLFSVAEIQE